MDRRGFLSACLAACAAPAIVRVGSLMVLPRKIVVPELFVFGEHSLSFDVEMSEMSEIMCKAFIPKLVVQIYDQSPLIGDLMRTAQCSLVEVDRAKPLQHQFGGSMLKSVREALAAGRGISFP